MRIALWKRPLQKLIRQKDQGLPVPNWKSASNHVEQKYVLKLQPFGPMQCHQLHFAGPIFLRSCLTKLRLCTVGFAIFKISFVSFAQRDDTSCLFEILKILEE